jgi:pilus assembly protein CpaE
VERVRLRLVSDDAAWCEELGRALGPVEDILIAEAIGLRELVPGLAAAVVLVDAGADLDAALEAVAAATRSEHGCAYILALRPGMDPEAAYPRAALAGVRLVLPAGCELPELTEGIYRTSDFVQPSEPEGADAAGAGGTDRVVTVFGTKGGVGRTTLAVNLAVALAARGLRTALLDLHLDWGNAAMYLRGSPPRPYGELLAEARRLDAELLQSFMIKHRTGVHLLAAPPKPEMAEFVSAEHVGAIVARAREGFDRVVVDTPPGFADTVFPALEGADHLLLVTTPDVPALRNARTALAVLDMLQVGRARTRLVVNRASAAYGVRRSDVEATLGLPVWSALPTDGPAVIRSANEGLPVVQAIPHSRFARAVAALARQLAPADARARPSRRAHPTPLRALRARV